MDTGAQPKGTPFDASADAPERDGGEALVAALVLAILASLVVFLLLWLIGLSPVMLVASSLLAAITTFVGILIWADQRGGRAEADEARDWARGCEAHDWPVAQPEDVIAKDVTVEEAATYVARLMGGGSPSYPHGDAARGDVAQWVQRHGREGAGKGVGGDLRGRAFCVGHCFHGEAARLAEICAGRGIDVDVTDNLDLALNAVADAPHRWDMLLVDIDALAQRPGGMLDLDEAVDELAAFRRRVPGVSVLIISHDFLRDELGLERHAITDASLRAPVSETALSRAILAAKANNRIWAEKLMAADPQVQKRQQH